MITPGGSQADMNRESQSQSQCQNPSVLYCILAAIQSIAFVLQDESMEL